MIGNTTVAESLIGVFIAMVLVISFRRRTHRVIELAVWAGLIWACLVALTANRDPHTQALTTSAIWGTSQVVGTIAGAFRLGALDWTYGARFLIADWVLLLFGADVLALALVSTNRQAGARTPATRLREWWVLPRLPGLQPERAPSAVDELNQRFNTWRGPAVVAAAMWSTLFLIWLRDVEIPLAARGLENVAFLARGLLRRAAGAQPGALGNNVVPLNSLSAPAHAIKVQGGATPSQSLTGTASAATRTDSNESKKHRQSRLAS